MTTPVQYKMVPAVWYYNTLVNSNCYQHNWRQAMQFLVAIVTNLAFTDDTAVQH